LWHLIWLGECRLCRTKRTAGKFIEPGRHRGKTRESVEGLAGDIVGQCLNTLRWSEGSVIKKMKTTDSQVVPSKSEANESITIPRKLGLALEEIGLDDVSVNRLANESTLHHRTVRRWLEYIYYIQNFIPKIDLSQKDDGGMAVHIVDLPAFVTDCFEEDHVSMLRLFRKKAFFGKKVALKPILAQMPAILGLGELVEGDYAFENIGLSPKGAQMAFELMDHASNIRDTAVKDMLEIAGELRAMRGIRQSQEQVYTRALALRNISANITVEKLNDSTESHRDFFLAIEEIEKLQRRLDKIRHDLASEMAPVVLGVDY